MITKSTIDKIFETARIEEVIEEFVPLKKSGSNLKGLSPFNNEKTPSFMVSPAKQIFKDFSSGKGGSVVTFLMEHEKLSYPEALKWLANKYNIEVEEDGTVEDKEARQQAEKEKESLFIANSFAQKHYTDNLLNTEEGRSIGLSYFKERGFSEVTIEKFQLGYALEKGDDLTESAKKAGYKVEILQKAGLTKEKGGRYFDFFRERVQFTIHNYIGKVVGFGGRTLSSNKNLPKYVNTAESEVYNKSKLLYGLNFAKNEIRKQDECLLVEGYTDVISLVQAGLENVVASSGTALTVEQVNLIKRITPNITMLYDGDAAGLKAAIRGVDLILEADMNVKVVVLPEGEDPDSTLRDMGATPFKDFIQKNAKDFIFFKTDYLLKDTKRDPVKKAEATREIIKSLALIPDVIKRSLYVRECSTLLDIGEQILITETNKIRNQKRLRKNRTEQREVEKNEDELISTPENKEGAKQYKERDRDTLIQERDIIRLLLEYAHKEIDENTVVEIILHELEGVDFDNNAYNKILNEYRSAYNNETVPDEQYFLSHEDAEISKASIDIIQSPYEISDNWLKKHDIVITDKSKLYKNDVMSALCLFKLRKVDKLIREVNHEIKVLENGEDKAGIDEKLNELLKQRMSYDSIRKELAKVMGITITH